MPARRRPTEAAMRQTAIRIRAHPMLTPLAKAARKCLPSSSPFSQQQRHAPPRIPATVTALRPRPAVMLCARRARLVLAPLAQQLPHAPHVPGSVVAVHGGHGQLEALPGSDVPACAVAGNALEVVRIQRCFENSKISKNREICSGLGQPIASRAPCADMGRRAQRMGSMASRARLVPPNVRQCKTRAGSSHAAAALAHSWRPRPFEGLPRRV